MLIMVLILFLVIVGQIFTFTFFERHAGRTAISRAQAYLIRFVSGSFDSLTISALAVIPLHRATTSNVIFIVIFIRVKITVFVVVFTLRFILIIIFVEGLTSVLLSTLLFRTGRLLA